MFPDPTSSAMLQAGDLSSLLSYWTPTIIGALIAVLIGAYFYFKSRKVKRVAYITSTRNLIQDVSETLSDIAVTFQGQPANNISVSKISIWNAGTDTVHGTDIVPVDPLRFMISGGKVLDAKIVRASQPSQFRIGQTSEGLQVSFDYLDKNQGALIQLVHTATSDESIRLTGSIKGGCSIVRGPLAPNRYLNRVDSILRLVLLLSILFLLASFLSTNRYGSAGPFNPDPILVMVGIALLVGSYAGSLFVRNLAKRIGAVPEVF